jgi:hypothetical protein
MPDWTGTQKRPQVYQIPVDCVSVAKCLMAKNSDDANGIFRTALLVLKLPEKSVKEIGSQ